ncbi:hypothetical protein [Cryobacterium glucosi]|uniref:hypothetical protein n=1 Tax=Cryobacterium glucosi TaxID=1259175 RepID=UPI0015810A02|nr:hypothetical protein [Cryobacterium glucosi]
MIANSDDCRDFSPALCTRRAKYDQFSARTTGEVEQIHPGEHSAVGGSNCRAHSMCTIFIGPGIRVCVDDLSCELNELQVFGARHCEFNFWEHEGNPTDRTGFNFWPACSQAGPSLAQNSPPGLQTGVE